MLEKTVVAVMRQQSSRGLDHPRGQNVARWWAAYRSSVEIDRATRPAGDLLEPAWRDRYVDADADDHVTATLALRRELYQNAPSFLSSQTRSLGHFN